LATIAARWHVNIYSDVKNIAHCIGVQRVGMHDVGECDRRGVHHMGVYGVDVSGIGVQKTVVFFSS
jgi:hypothetical protein